MQPRVAVLLYPGCIFFEIALAAETLANACEVRYFTPDGKPILTSNAATVAPAGSFDDVEPFNCQAVLVPGGDPAAVLLPTNLAAGPLIAAAKRGALIAGICAGGLVIASTGLLVGRRATHNYTPEHASPEQVATAASYLAGVRFERANLVRDGPFLTAQPWAYRDFAAAVAEQLGVLTPAQAEQLESYPSARRYWAV